MAIKINDETGRMEEPKRLSVEDRANIQTLMERVPSPTVLERRYDNHLTNMFKNDLKFLLIARQAMPILLFQLQELEAKLARQTESTHRDHTK